MERTVKRGFTVIELMVVIAIIALLAGMALSALGGAAEQARAQRTRAIVEKIDQLIMEKWDSYRTRAVPYTRGADPRTSAVNRLNAIRELQRLELPQCKSDVLDNPQYLSGSSIPAVNRGYRRKATASWDGAYEEAECLYLIVSSIKDGDKSAIDFFTSSEIGDLDNDGMPEILDGWGNPLVFIRWPSGYLPDATNPALTMQSREIPDPFDPLMVDPYNSDTDTTNNTYALTPLIYSMGPDGANGIQVTGGLFQYSQTPRVKNDPYHVDTDTGLQFGAIADATQAADNITNHSP